MRSSSSSKFSFKRLRLSSKFKDCFKSGFKEFAGFAGSRKAQFMIITALAMVSIFYLISKWLEPYNLLDTAEVVLMEEPFVFNNIKEKALELVNTSTSCEDLVYNLEEYKKFIEDYAFRKLVVYFDYSLETPCYEYDPRFPVLVLFNIELRSDKMKVKDKFYGFWPPGSSPF